MNTWPREHTDSYTSDTHIHVWQEWVGHIIGSTSATEQPVRFRECSGCGVRVYHLEVVVRW